jgi:hypothetical protein
MYSVVKLSVELWMLPEFDASIETVTLTVTCFTQEEVPLCFGYEIVRCSLMCTAAY